MGQYTDPSRLGLVNASGSDTEALFLKIFSGEIVTTFEKSNIMMPLHRVRTIQTGKSAIFPVTGTASAGYHTPGESVLSQSTAGTAYGTATSGGAVGTLTVPVETVAQTSKYLNKFKHNERTVFIDDILVSSTFVADIDEMKNHYDVRSIYSTEIGRSLAYTADKNLIRTVIGGARVTTDRFGVASGTDTTYLGAIANIGHAGGSNAMHSASILAGFANVARKMDERNVPNDERFAVVTPEVYYLLLGGNSDAINRDFSPDNGSIATGQIASAYGIRIMKSNHIPQTNETSGSGTVDPLAGAAGVRNNPNGGSLKYSGLNYNTSAAKTQGIIFHREAIATVKLLDLSLETDYIMERMGTLMLAKYAMGHNILREECCYELQSASNGTAA
jgi:hypothetical protein